MGKFKKPMRVLLETPLDENLFKGVRSACAELGWQAINLIHHYNYIPSTEPIAGAIVSAQSQPKQLLQKLLTLDIPVVTLGNVEIDSFHKLPCILEDRYQAGCLAAHVFTERQFSNLALIDIAEASTRDELFTGFKASAPNATFCDLRLPAPEKLDPDIRYDRTLLYDHFVQLISSWLQKQPLPVGILALNYTMATRLIAAAELAGLLIPEQVAIICRGNQKLLCETTAVPLSAIDVNEEETGKQAIQLLKRIRDGASLPAGPIKIPPKCFIERRSTDILAVHDKKVGAAIRFMWDHLDKPLSVDDIAFEMKVSRNTLERAFRSTLGRGVHAELRRKRFEYSKELLRNTDMTVSEIVAAIGLTGRRYFHRAFLEYAGMPPHKYRKAHQRTKFGWQATS